MDGAPPKDLRLMTNPHFSPMRRAIVLAAITSIAAVAPAAVAAPASKSKASKRSASADLVVRDLEVEFAGETLQIFADVANVGGRRAERRSDAVVAISSDETLDDEDEVLDETSVRRLRSHRSYELETEVEIPADEDLPEGDVYLLVCADGNDAVSEKAEDNNCSAELIATEDDAVSDDDASDEDDTSAGDDQSDDGEDFPVNEER